MRIASRHIALALVVATTACTNIFNDEPTAQPGTPVAGLSGGSLCWSGGPCHAWAPDSKTLYITARLSSNPGGSLVAIDPAAATYKRVANIDSTARGLVVSPDGATLYYAVPPAPPFDMYVIKKMTLATGGNTVIIGARRGDFSISGDGKTLAYLAAGGTAAADTIVALDLPSNTRRASTVVNNLFIGPLSPDGSRLLISGGGGGDPRIFQVWNITTGDVQTIPTGTWGNFVNGRAWSGNNPRFLFTPSPSSPTQTDTTIGTGNRIVFNLPSYPRGIIWLPDLHAMYTYSSRTICGRECNGEFWEFFYATPTGMIKLGSVYANAGLVMGSPDGHWLVHSLNPSAVYVLGR